MDRSGRVFEVSAMGFLLTVVLATTALIIAVALRPLTIRFRFAYMDGRGTVEVYLGVPLFRWLLVFKSDTMITDEQPAEPGKQGGIAAETSRALRDIRGWVSVVKNVVSRKHRLTELTWLTSYGTADASMVAVGYGAIWGAKSILMPLIAELWGPITSRPRIDVRPVFGSTEFKTRLECTFRITPGYAALETAREMFRARLGGS